MNPPREGHTSSSALVRDVSVLRAVGPGQGMRRSERCQAGKQALPGQTVLKQSLLRGWGPVAGSPSDASPLSAESPWRRGCPPHRSSALTVWAGSAGWTWRVGVRRGCSSPAEWAAEGSPGSATLQVAWPHFAFLRRENTCRFLELALSLQHFTRIGASDFLILLLIYLFQLEPRK